MYLPLGSQLGEANSLLGSLETCFAPVPSACMIQMLSLPSRSERNAIHCPSGENLGWLSKDMPPVNQFGLTTFDRQRINVAEQFESDGLAVWRDIERKPGAFVGGEGDLAIGLQRQTFFFVLLFVLSFRLSCLCPAHPIAANPGECPASGRTMFLAGQRGSRPRPSPWIRMNRRRAGITFMLRSPSEGLRNR